MAASPREHAPAVVEKLLERPKTFSFVQAVRLITLFGRASYGGEGAVLHKGLKVVPDLSLGHPSTDIVSIRRETAAAEGALPRYSVVATFLSLYGASSPLPTFYTEELLDEARQGESASRDFLDIFNQALYTLYYQAYNKYKLGLRSREEKARSLWDMQYSLLGMGGETLRREAGTSERDLRFIGLFSRHAHSAHGLRQYLALRLDYTSIDIEQCVERNMPIPEDQLCRLGRAALNGETAIGRTIRDVGGAFRVHLRDLDESAALRFQPGGEGRAALETAVRHYLSLPLGYDIVLHVRANSLSGARLGNPASGRIGMNAFMVRPAGHPARTYVAYRQNS